jgi:hypothetical protein
VLAPPWIADFIAPNRRSARSSADFCSSAVTMAASGPGKTVARWSVSSHRTTYGGEPSGERTSLIKPRLSGWSIVVPLITSQSPTFAFMDITFQSDLHGARIWTACGKGRGPDSNGQRSLVLVPGEFTALDLRMDSRRSHAHDAHHAGSRITLTNSRFSRRSPPRCARWSPESTGRPSAGSPLLGAVDLAEAEHRKLPGDHPRERMQRMGDPFLVGNDRDAFEGRMMLKECSETQL